MRVCAFEFFRGTVLASHANQVVAFTRVSRSCFNRCGPHEADVALALDRHRSVAAPSAVKFGVLDPSACGLFARLRLLGTFNVLCSKSPAESDARSANDTDTLIWTTY